MQTLVHRLHSQNACLHDCLFEKLCFLIVRNIDKTIKEQDLFKRISFLADIFISVRPLEGAFNEYIMKCDRYMANLVKSTNLYRELKNDTIPQLSTILSDSKSFSRKVHNIILAECLSVS